jgi:hypothetical protein
MLALVVFHVLYGPHGPKGSGERGQAGAGRRMAKVLFYSSWYIPMPRDLSILVGIECCSIFLHMLIQMMDIPKLCFVYVEFFLHFSLVALGSTTVLCSSQTHPVFGGTWVLFAVCCILSPTWNAECPHVRGKC